MNPYYSRSSLKTSSLLKILTSKRLLIDHLEVLEECLSYSGNEKALKFISKSAISFNAGFLGCILATAWSIRYSRSYIANMCISATSAMLVGVMAYTKFDFKWKLNKITRLIVAIESFDNSMKRGLMLINEMMFGSEKTSSLPICTRQDEVILKCVVNCKLAINNIHQFVKLLEMRTEIRNDYAYAYEPLESMDNCDAFCQNTKPGQGQAKQLYNIFLYIQSHCLFRLALAIASDVEFVQFVDDMSRLIEGLTANTEQIMKCLMVNITSREDRYTDPAYLKPSISKEIFLLRNQSLELTVKLTASVKQMVLLDEVLQSITKIEATQDLNDVEKQLDALHTNLLTRTDECERLLISVKKILNHAMLEPADGDKMSDFDPDLEEDLDVNYSSSALEPIDMDDEFFINIGTEGEEPDGFTSTYEALQAEEELVTKKLMKKQFRPVLRQLRERLEPIERSFKQREKNAMKMKGIELPEETSSDHKMDEHDSSTSASSHSEASDSEDSGATPIRRNQHRYDDVRNFLASKQQINLLSSLPAGIQMEESILE